MLLSLKTCIEGVDYARKLGDDSSEQDILGKEKSFRYK